MSTISVTLSLNLSPVAPALNQRSFVESYSSDDSRPPPASLSQILVFLSSQGRLFCSHLSPFLWLLFFGPVAVFLVVVVIALLYPFLFFCSFYYPYAIGWTYSFQLLLDFPCNNTRIKCYNNCNEQSALKSKVKLKEECKTENGHRKEKQSRVNLKRIPNEL